MMQFYNAEQSRLIDRFAIEKQHIPGLLLMKRAGLFSFQTLEKFWPDSKHLTVFCGTGNNGGDGFVIAQLAMIAGYDLDVFIVGERAKISNEAKQALIELEQLGLTIKPFDQIQAQQSLAQTDLVIDALLGTGLRQAPKADYADAIEIINQHNKPVLAIDIPSGLSADTGTVLGHAVKATRTCTFISQKIGLYTHQGQEFSGKVHFSPLFLKQSSYENFPPLAQNHSLKHWLKKTPKRLPSQHKGMSGSVCLVGGNHNMMGAIQLAGLASLRSGAGLVKIITRKSHLTAITQNQPELMCYDKTAMASQAALSNAIAIGPGLGTDLWAQQRFNETLDLPQAKVIDADALKLLADNSICQQQSNWVLTPHPGEAAYLLGCSNQEIQNDRVKAVKALHERYGGIIVLKGNGTLIYDGEHLEICLAGNPGMAIGGMGDVLTGCIATFLAQGVSPFAAACLGVTLHAHAGDIVAKQQGQISVLPSELAQTISQLLVYR
ncbi:NAD(P)H-hydrate dehydratase [Thiomicrorhabdus sediminis]|uniref:Bifunctional NAD(P)H-hydrate repair enzyme n=1 Tax=Thiomicrorhabdus sediminis TaxID=2580412 RepID=A0A4P9K6Y1_9GAMM|nr:NAD(P)H-hydrate dehydratase [Thiomicrorhabdus sediminis]QCU90825.1 NAD(P)H-hydrate dehydratase [Thiomicrorhabdus sediminis]